MLVAQSCPTLHDPMDCRLPGSSVNGIVQARILEWIAMPFPRISSWTRVHVTLSSVAHPCPTLCNPIKCSMPGLPVHHQLPEFTQMHIHWVSDAFQPSHPLLSPSPPASNLSWHQGLFQGAIGKDFTSSWQSIGASTLASVLSMNIQDWFPLGWTGWISLQSKGPSRVFSNTPVQKHQFFGVQLSHICTWLLEKP